MAIRDLQLNLVELGRIRLGQKKAESGRPDRLDTYRFTSPAQHLIEEVAGLYGGTVQVWSGGHGKQWEVVTETSLIPIYLPQQVIDPFYESWRGGVCTRRCDGLRDSIHQTPCDCDSEKRACKPTTHLLVMLADVPGIGNWRVTTHGIWAASELSHLSTLISGIQIPLPGRLLLENRERKHWDRSEQKVVTKNFNVPVVLIDAVTSRHIQLGHDAVSQALRLSNGAQAAAIESAPAAVEAIEAASSASPSLSATPQDIERELAAIAAATTRDRMMQIQARIRELGDPLVLTNAWLLRAKQLVDAENAQATASAASPTAQQTQAPPHTAPPRQQIAEDPWDGEEQAAEAAFAAQSGAVVPTLDPEPSTAGQGDKRAVMMELLGLAGERKIKTAQLDAMIKEQFKTDRVGVTAAQLRQLADQITKQPV